MKLLRYIKAPLIIGVIAVLCFILHSDAYAQRRIFLNRGNLGASDQNPTGVAEFDVKLGETFTLDVWFAVGTLDITGISTYITFDNFVFEVIDQNPVPEVQPFLLSGGFSVFTQHSANLVEDPNTIPGYQIAAHSQLSTGRTLRESGRFARLAFTATGISDSSWITIDYDPQNFRDTRMFFTNLTSRRFDIFGSVKIRVLGVNVSGIPDVLMEPGQTLENHFDLDNFLLNEPEDASTLGWTVSPSVQDSVFVTIDPTTHEVDISTLPTFTGFRDFIFTVNDPQGIKDSDTMRVSVSYKPEFRGNMPDPIVFNEDEVFTGLLLDTLAQDLDDDSTTLTWSGYSINENILVSFSSGPSRTFSVTGTSDYNGVGDLVFRITDPKGMTDSLITRAIIRPVNDPPRISGLKDIHILPGQVDTSIILQDHVIDVDSPLETIKYSWTGELNVVISLDENTRLTISGKPGFVGTETVIFRAWDIHPTSATFDTMRITVGPKPPFFITELPDTTIMSSNLVSVVQYVDLDDYVRDDDNPLSSLLWSAQGNLLSINIGSDHVAQFVVPAGMHAFEEVTFRVSDPEGASVQDKIRVLVLDNGRPLITGLPDLMFIQVGGDTTITLDDFVVDKDTPIASLTWSTSGNSNISISITPASPHIATISSPNTTFSGKERITFTVKDTDNNRDTHVMDVQAIAPGKPILSDIPDIEITKNRDGKLDLDDYLVIVPESDRAGIVWTVSPPSDPKVAVSIDRSTNEATFTVVDKDFRDSRTFIFTATNSANGQSASDQMSVKVTFGKDPILGYLPNVEFVSGDSSEAINLNKYVIDEDTPDDSILWVIESTNINASAKNLKRGADHVLVLSARQGFVGIEDIMVTAVDPEGNSDSSVMRVFVRSSASLDLIVLPNPISADYIDIVIFASDTLVGTPSVRLDINGSSQNIDVQKIGDELIWKADYVFEKNQTGDVKIVAIAADNFGSTIKDSTQFSLGLLSKSIAYYYSGDKASVYFPPEFSENERKLLIMPDRNMELFNWNLKNSELPFTLEPPLQSIYIGSSVKENEIKKKGSILFDLNDRAVSADLMRRMGIYYYGYESREIEFVSNQFDLYSKTLLGSIDRFGMYFLAADLRVPELSLLEISNRGEVKIKVGVRELESGINSFKTVIGPNEYENSVTVLPEEVYEITVENFEETGAFVLFVSVSDKAGNISEPLTVPFSRDKSSVPDSYRLLQNYPNPFNPSTKIDYVLPRSDHVVLNVYNIAGQLVVSLVNEQQSAGFYTVVWDGSNESGMQAAAGIYLYEIRTNNYHQRKKMVLLK